MSASHNAYSTKTLVGNWQELRTREEDAQHEFLTKCEKGSLAIQRMARLKETFLDFIPTTESTDEFVRWNDKIGLVCPSPMKHLVEGNFSLPRPRILVCVDLDSSLIYGKMKFIEGTKIVGSTDLKPMARTVFQIVSPTDCPSECKVTYGTPVQFRLASDAVSDEPMYMASDFINTAGGSNRLSGHRQVFLSANRCAYNTHWKLEHMYPQLRMEMEGTPIYVDRPLIVRHCKTNSALAIEPFTQNGFFGREYEVSAHDHLDGHRAESNCNFFCLCTNLDVCEEHPEECTLTHDD